VSEELVTSTHQDADTMTVALHGEVDVLTVDEVRHTLGDAVAASPG
jgi:anti-sigma B factor antagonist